MGIIDSHAHLNDEMLIDKIDSVVLNMKEFNIDKVLIPGWDIVSSIKSIELSNKYPMFYSLIGIHPENIDGMSLSDIDKIKDLSINKKVIGIGEIGLDYHYTKENKDLQAEFLIKQIELAYSLNLPFVIHMRDATEDILSILKSSINKLGKRENMGIIHSYSGSIETMNELIKLGFLISFSGPVTFKNAKIQKECAINCPLDKILVETDSPYLSPEPFRGKMNEPKNTYYTLKYISELKGIDIKVLEEATTKNFNKLFKMEENL